MVTVDRTSLDSFLPPHQLERMVPQLQAAWDTLWKGTGAGNDFLGWRDLPVGEGICKRKLPDKAEWVINAAGLALLLLFMCVVTFSDITKLFS